MSGRQDNRANAGAIVLATIASAILRSMETPPEGIVVRSGSDLIRSVELRRCKPNLYLFFIVPFWIALWALGIVGVSGANVLLGLAALVVAALCTWPIASTLFGREQLDIGADGITWRRHLGKLGRTRQIPLSHVADVGSGCLGVDGLLPTDNGGVLLVTARPPHDGFFVGRGFGFSDDALLWLTHYVASGLEQARMRHDSAQHGA